MKNYREKQDHSLLENGERPQDGRCTEENVYVKFKHINSFLHVDLALLLENSQWPTVNDNRYFSFC